MNLPQLKNAVLENKKVIIRADLDVDFDGGETELLRLNVLIPTLNYLLSKNAKIIIIGHKGRPSFAEASAGKPEGAEMEKFSLRPVCQKLSELLGKEIKFIPEVLPKLIDKDLVMLENLRFDKREEENNEEFAKTLASYADIYVNEAFGSSHREHASVVGIPKFIPKYAGIRLSQEIENLSKAIENPARPVVTIISGVKKDKLGYIDNIAKFSDKILIGGRLPEYIEQMANDKFQISNNKLILANLIADKEDITLHSVENFKTEIVKAKTIILAGVPGRYEDEGHRQGTKEVFEAVAVSNAFKIAGGGDSIVAIYMFKLQDKFNWISVGGGAMLEFLANGTLPGIDALLH
jgi:phosphoglycerate kinase